MRRRFAERKRVERRFFFEWNRIQQRRELGGPGPRRMRRWRSVLVQSLVQSVATEVVAIAVGESTALAVDRSGAALAWGNNTSGQGGIATPMKLLLPTVVAGIASARVPAVGLAAHACVAAASGASCFGNNTSNRLGRSEASQTSTPVTVKTLSGEVSAIATGDSHGCAVAGGALKCWGANDQGQLGTGGTSTRVAVEVLANVREVACGMFHTCSITTDDRLQCWGNATDGQLGHGSNVRADRPVTVTWPPQ